MLSPYCSGGLAQLKETDRAYIAGLFDGEGCVCPYYSTQESKKWVVQRITITNTNKQLLENIQKELGYGHLRRRTKQDGRRQCWSLEFTASKDVKAFIDCVMPYVRLKKLHLLLSQEMVNTTKWGRHIGYVLPQEVKDLRELCMRLLKELNRRGDSEIRGEFSEKLTLFINRYADTEPSSPNGVKVGEKVQRLTGEEPTNKPDTSAPPEREDIVRA